MKTLYIDVYFLINFTVDLLSLYFGALLSKVTSSVKRLIAAAFVSAVFACFMVLSNLNGVLYAVVLVANGMLVTMLFCGKIALIRQIKLFLAFLIFETLIGGFVTFIYGTLDRYFQPLFNEGSVGAENKSLIILALLIVIVYGILRLLLLAFTGSASEKNAKIRISVLGAETTVDALVDSGNLLCDPIDSSAVVIVKRCAVIHIIGSKRITDDERLTTRVRIIPAKTLVGEKILMGIKTDYLALEDKDVKFENTVIAIDEEEGSFGGYLALLPSSFLTR